MERDKKYASRNSLRITNLAVIILLIIVLLFWWRGNSNGDVKLKGVNPNQISIRQDNGQIQYQFLDGEWQNIISISELKGEKGEAGANGRDGANGKNGENGAPGKDGLNGQNGIDGNNGANGKDGKDGVNGANGRDGAQGAKGDKGDRGEQGLKGDTGAQGAKGDKGDRGEQGLKGDTGAQGAKGDKGDRGTDGREIELRKDSLYIQWRYKGDSSWNNLIAYSDLKGDKGDKGDKGEQGVQGPKGDQGIQGLQGLKGDTGAQGAKGDKGDKGDRGEQGIQGPQGLKGEQGIQGIAGVGVPQTLSLNNGILSLSHGGGNVTLPQANFSEIVKIPLNSAHPTSVFSSGSAGERTWHDFRNYMIFNKTTGQGFIHIDFWTTGSTMMALVNIPNSAPTPKELSETPLNNDDNSTVWIEKGSRTIYGRPRANKRYIANIPIFVDPSR